MQSIKGKAKRWKSRSDMANHDVDMCLITSTNQQPDLNVSKCGLRHGKWSCHHAPHKTRMWLRPETTVRTYSDHFRYKTLRSVTCHVKGHCRHPQATRHLLRLMNKVSGPVAALPPAPLTSASELDFYSQLSRIESDVLAGCHPHIKLPDHAIREYLQSGHGLHAAAIVTSSTLPVPVQPGKSTLPPLKSFHAQDHQNNVGAPSRARDADQAGKPATVVPHEPNIDGSRLPHKSPAWQAAQPALSSSVVARPFVSSIDPVLLTKSDDLIRAEHRLKRQRIERSIKDTGQANRATRRDGVPDKDSEISTGANYINVAEVYERALAIVKPVSGLVTPPVVDEISADAAASDSNSYYSSQGNSWASGGPKNAIDEMTVLPVIAPPSSTTIPLKSVTTGDNLIHSAMVHTSVSRNEKNVANTMAQPMPVTDGAISIAPNASLGQDSPLPSGVNDSRDESYSPPAAPAFRSLKPAYRNDMDGANDQRTRHLRQGALERVRPARYVEVGAGSDSYSPPQPVRDQTPLHLLSTPELQFLHARHLLSPSALHLLDGRLATHDPDNVNDASDEQAIRNTRLHSNTGKTRNRRVHKLQRTAVVAPIAHTAQSEDVLEIDDDYVPLPISRKRARAPENAADVHRQSGKRHALQSSATFARRLPSLEQQIKPEPVSPPQDLTGVPASEYPRRVVIRDDGSTELQIFSPKHNARPQAARQSMQQYRHIDQATPRLATQATQQIEDYYSPVSQPAYRYISQTSVAPPAGRPAGARADQDLRRVASLHNASRTQAGAPYSDDQTEEVIYGGPTSRYVSQVLDYHRQSPVQFASRYERAPMPSTYGSNHFTHGEDEQAFHAAPPEDDYHAVVAHRSRAMPPPPRLRRMIDADGVEWVSTRPTVARAVVRTASYAGAAETRAVSRQQSFLPPNSEEPFLSWNRYPIDSRHDQPPREVIDVDSPSVGMVRRKPLYDDGTAADAPSDAIIDSLERQMQVMSEQIRSLRAASRAPSRVGSYMPPPSQSRRL